MKTIDAVIHHECWRTLRKCHVREMLVKKYTHLSIDVKPHRLMSI